MDMVHLLNERENEADAAATPLISERKRSMIRTNRVAKLIAFSTLEELPAV
jgi:hypothetical protein